MTTQSTLKCRSRSLAAILLASALVTAPRLALACAVCFSGRDDDVQLAFRISTGLMTLLPFVLVGGLLLWLRKRFREIAAEGARGAVPVDETKAAESS